MADIYESTKLRALLTCLGDGGFHSGETLGRLLGISRAAVWKQLQRLESLGIRVESVKGRGYRLSAALELLDRQRIDTELTPAAQNAICKIDVFNQIDSTNTYLLRQVDAHGRVCLAESQTAGRGRRGRDWFSPFARNLYFSLGWSFEGGLSSLEGLSLAIGVGISRALCELGVSGVQLKWPNDLLCEEKKLAGILIEVTGDPTGSCMAVIGVGLNVDMTGVAVGTEQVSQPWVDLHAIASKQQLSLPGRNQLVAGILNHLVPILANYSRDRFKPYRVEWDSLCAFAGREVVITNGVQQSRGVLLGANDQGALRLLERDVEQLYFGGELSLRPAS